MDNILLARVLISNKLADEDQLKKLWKHIRPNKDIAAILVELGQLKAQVYVQLVEFTYKQMGVTDFKVEAPRVLSATEQAEMLQGEVVKVENIAPAPKTQPQAKVTETPKPAPTQSAKEISKPEKVEVKAEVQATQVEGADIPSDEIPCIDGVVSTRMGTGNFSSKPAPIMDGLEKTQMGRFGGRL